MKYIIKYNDEMVYIYIVKSNSNIIYHVKSISKLNICNVKPSTKIKYNGIDLIVKLNNYKVWLNIL